MNRLNEIFLAQQITHFGMIPFDSLSHLLECRQKTRIPQNAKTVIVCLFPYYNGILPKHNVSRYATIPDYHAVLGIALQQTAAMLQEAYAAAFEPFIDSSPIPEVEAALKAGLGIKGMQGLLINEEYGTFHFIGTIVTDYAFPCHVSGIVDCAHCGACQHACPTGAIGANGVDYTRCLSHITQRKGTLTDWEQAKLRENGLIWGCDACQNCCPHNQCLQESQMQGFEQMTAMVTLENLDALMKTQAFGYRGKATLLRNLEIVQNKSI